MSRTVTSPAGEPIEIFTNEEWAELTGKSDAGLRMWSGLKPLVVQALWINGEFSQGRGFTSNEIMQWILTHHPTFEKTSRVSAIMHLFRDPLNMPLVETQVKGKRVYSVKLVALPERWYKRLLIDVNGFQANSPVEAPVVPQEGLGPPVIGYNGATQTEPQEAPEASQEADWSDSDWEALKLDAPTVFETEPPIELHLASQVAMSLLTTVVEIISAGTADTSRLSATHRLQQDLEHVQGTLAARLDENQRLRKQLREASEMVVTLRDERDGLRSRLRATEQNLAQVLKGETAGVVNAEIHKRIDQIMRTPPKAKGE